MPVAGMERLRPVLASAEGWIRGTAQFARERGRPVAQLEFAAQVQLRCQRCLEPMTVRLQGGSLVHLVPDEAAAQGLPEDAEMLLAPEGRVPLQDLVEEDLLLSLPIAPRHEGGFDSGSCGATLPTDGGDDAQQVQRPFAALEELMRSTARRGRGD
ncbi:MAG: YceD family protein [Steroidobacteraceae bacterium]